LGKRLRPEGLGKLLRTGAEPRDSWLGTRLHPSEVDLEFRFAIGGQLVVY
jgi:hypothetical protein